MSDTHATRKGLAAVGQSASETARETVEDAVEHGKEWAGNRYDRAARTARQWRDRGAQQYEKAREQVRLHAISSTLIAFGAGFVISRFLFRR